MRTGTSAFGVVFALLLALAATRVTAAERTVKAPGPFSPVPVADWGGFYVGGNLGATWGYFKNNNLTVGPTGTGGNVSGGGQVGYNFQRGRWVFGAEGDASLIDVRASSNTVGSFKERWTSSLRGRFGYAVENYLAYLTAGVAFTNVKAELTATGTSESRTLAGVIAGFGVEMMIAPNWSARVEALYTDVPKHTFTPAGGTMVGGSDNFTIRAGANYWIR